MMPLLGGTLAAAARDIKAARNSYDAIRQTKA